MSTRFDRGGLGLPPNLTAGSSAKPHRHRHALKLGCLEVKHRERSWRTLRPPKGLSLQRLRPSSHFCLARRSPRQSQERPRASPQPHRGAGGDRLGAPSTFHNAGNGSAVLRIRPAVIETGDGGVRPCLEISAGEWVTVSGHLSEQPGSTPPAVREASFLRASAPHHQRHRGIRYLGSGMSSAASPNLRQSQLVALRRSGVRGDASRRPEQSYERCPGIGPVRGQADSARPGPIRGVREHMRLPAQPGAATRQAVRHSFSRTDCYGGNSTRAG